MLDKEDIEYIKKRRTYSHSKGGVVCHDDCDDCPLRGSTSRDALIFYKLENRKDCGGLCSSIIYYFRNLAPSFIEKHNKNLEEIAMDCKLKRVLKCLQENK